MGITKNELLERIINLYDRVEEADLQKFEDQEIKDLLLEEKLLLV